MHTLYLWYCRGGQYFCFCVFCSLSFTFIRISRCVLYLHIRFCFSLLSNDLAYRFVGFLILFFAFLVFVCLNSFSRLETFESCFICFPIYLVTASKMTKIKRSRERAWRARAQTHRLTHAQWIHKRGTLILNAWRSNNVSTHTVWL